MPALQMTTRFLPPVIVLSHRTAISNDQCIMNNQFLISQFSMQPRMRLRRLENRIGGLDLNIHNTLVN